MPIQWFATRAVVVEQPGAAPVAGQGHVQPSVPVVIEGGHAPPYVRHPEERAGPGAKLTKAPSPEILEEVVPLTRRDGIGVGLDVIHDVAVRDVQVGIGVVVEVQKLGAPPDEQETRRPQSRPVGADREGSIPVVQVELVQLVAHVSDEDVHAAVVIHVRRVHSHPGFRPPLLAEPRARNQGHVGEGAVALVPVQEVAHRIVRDE